MYIKSAQIAFATLFAYLTLNSYKCKAFQVPGSTEKSPDLVRAGDKDCWPCTYELAVGMRLGEVIKMQNKLSALGKKILELAKESGNAEKVEDMTLGDIQELEGAVGEKLKAGLKKLCEQSLGSSSFLITATEAEEFPKTATMSLDDARRMRLSVAASREDPLGEIAKYIRDSGEFGLWPSFENSTFEELEMGDDYRLGYFIEFMLQQLIRTGFLSEEIAATSEKPVDCFISRNDEQENELTKPKARTLELVDDEKERVRVLSSLDYDSKSKEVDVRSEERAPNVFDGVDGALDDEGLLTSVNSSDTPTAQSSAENESLAMQAIQPKSEVEEFVSEVNQREEVINRPTDVAPAMAVSLALQPPRSMSPLDREHEMARTFPIVGPSQLHNEPKRNQLELERDDLNAIENFALFVNELKGVLREYLEPSDSVCFNVLRGISGRKTYFKLTERGYQALLQGTQLISRILRLCEQPPGSSSQFELDKYVSDNKARCLRVVLPPRLIIRAKQAGRIFFKLFPVLRTHVLQGRAGVDTTHKLSDLVYRIPTRKFSAGKRDTLKRFFEGSKVFLASAEETIQQLQPSREGGVGREDPDGGRRIKIGTEYVIHYDADRMGKIRETEMYYVSTDEEEDWTRKFVYKIGAVTQENQDVSKTFTQIVRTPQTEGQERSQFIETDDEHTHAQCTDSTHNVIIPETQGIRALDEDDEPSVDQNTRSYLEEPPRLEQRKTEKHKDFSQSVPDMQLTNTRKEAPIETAFVQTTDVDGFSTSTTHEATLIERAEEVSHQIVMPEENLVRTEVTEVHSMQDLGAIVHQNPMQRLEELGASSEPINPLQEAPVPSDSQPTTSLCTTVTKDLNLNPSGESPSSTDKTNPEQSNLTNSKERDLKPKASSELPHSSTTEPTHVGIGDKEKEILYPDPKSVTSPKPQDSTAEADLPLIKEPLSAGAERPPPKRPFIPVGGNKDGPVNKVAAFFTTIFLLIFSFICFICLWGSTGSGAAKLGKVDFISKISNKISGNTEGRSGLIRIEQPRGGLLDTLPLHEAIRMSQVTTIKKNDVDFD